jgi:hypothetical protein
MPKIPVGKEGDYIWVDSWDYVLSFNYTETREAYDAFSGSGITIYERMVMRYKGQIPYDYWLLEVEGTDYNERTVTIRRYWAHKDHHRFVPASRFKE